MKRLTTFIAAGGASGTVSLVRGRRRVRLPALDSSRPAANHPAHSREETAGDQE